MNLVTNVLIFGRRRPSTRTTSTRTRTTIPLQRDQILQCRRRCYRKQGLCVYIKLDQYTIQSVFFLLFVFVCIRPCMYTQRHPSLTTNTIKEQLTSSWRRIFNWNWNSGNIETRYFLYFEDFWNRQWEWISYNFLRHHGVGLDHGLTCSSSST